MINNAAKHCSITTLTWILDTSEWQPAFILKVIITCSLSSPQQIRTLLYVPLFPLLTETRAHRPDFIVWTETNGAAALTRQHHLRKGSKRKEVKERTVSLSGLFNYFFWSAQNITKAFYLPSCTVLWKIPEYPCKTPSLHLQLSVITDMDLVDETLEGS